MGLLFVLIFWAIAFSVLALIAAGSLIAVALWATKHHREIRKAAVIRAGILPFVCVAFAGVWFVGYAFINGSLRDRDPMLGDGWQTPLPNGYELSMIDVTDQGAIYRLPKNSLSQPAVDGVRQLQIDNNYILGARDSGYFSKIGQDSSFVDTYFEIETKSGALREFKDLNQLRQLAVSQGIKCNLQQFDSVYSQYRFTWFDWSAFLLLFAVPGTLSVLLLRWLWKIHKSPQSAPPIPNSTIAD